MNIEAPVSFLMRIWAMVTNAKIANATAEPIEAMAVTSNSNARARINNARSPTLAYPPPDADASWQKQEARSHL